MLLLLFTCLSYSPSLSLSLSLSLSTHYSRVTEYLRVRLNTLPRRLSLTFIRLALILFDGCSDMPTTSDPQPSSIILPTSASVHGKRMIPTPLRPSITPQTLFTSSF